MCIFVAVTRPATAQQKVVASEQDFPRNHFMSALVARSGETRALAIDRIEREYGDNPQAVTTVMRTLDRIEGDPQHRGAAMDLVHLLTRMEHPEVPPYLLALLQSPDHRIVMIAMDGLIQQRHVEAIDPVLLLVERPEFASRHGFRVAVLEAVITLRHPKGRDFLIRLLPNLRGESAAIVIDYLSGFSREDLGKDPQQWRMWQEELDRSMIRFDTVSQRTSEIDSSSSSQGSYFFGIQIRAERLVFVIDKSASMSERLVTDVLQSSSESDSETQATRLARAQDELMTAISGLPTDAHFNILVFDGTVARWRPRLMTATLNNKASAARFVMNIVASGETASFDALRDAFSLDQNLEAVYLLSDGVPTVGRIVPAPEIIHAVSTENFFRRISINTIGIGVDRTPARFLRKLAERNRGEYEAIGNDGAAATARMLPQKSQPFLPRKVFTPPMPPILAPRVQTAAVAAKRLKDDELVLGIALDGASRAYPLNMLTGPNREIINDEVGGRPIAATWCHLAHCATVYDRRIDDQTLTMAVSGLLWNETLVMVDTTTRSLWGQLTGKAMSGDLQGKDLRRLPAVVTDWASWYEQHPETTVTMLSRTARLFDRGAFSILSDFVVGVTKGEAARAWSFDELIYQPAVNDKLTDEPILVTFHAGSRTASVFQRRIGDQTLHFEYEGGKLTDNETGSIWSLAEGQAITGPLRGKSLVRLPSVVTYHENWAAFYPASTFFNE